MTPAINSIFGNFEKSIFAHVSALAREHNAINLGQGFPDFDGGIDLKNLLSAAMQRPDNNQYTDVRGIPLLRYITAKSISCEGGKQYNADTEVTITPSGTYALFTALFTITRQGDEVIVLEPAFNIYRPIIEAIGGKYIPVALNKDAGFRPDFDAISQAITPKTRALIINTPHNPTGSVWSVSDMQKLQDILAPTSVILISDEVYEYMVLDGARHESVARYAPLAERTFKIGSYGKTFSVTGWRIGYVAAPESYTELFRAIHQHISFSVHTPTQWAIGQYMQDPQHYLSLSPLLQEKRDFFASELKSHTRFKLLPCQGGYFQCVDYSSISDLDDVRFNEWLCKEIGVVGIPLSPFYKKDPNLRLLRFCFAKQKETLIESINRLKRL